MKSWLSCVLNFFENGRKSLYAIVEVIAVCVVAGGEIEEAPYLHLLSLPID